MIVKQGGIPGGIVLGDIGGTNARFAILSKGRMSQPERLSVASYPTIVAALAEFAGKQPIQLSGAVLAVAGPVEANRVEMTNSPWVVDGAELAAAVNGQVQVINDFAAIAWALPALAAGDVEGIGGGSSQPGAPAAVLGPGTGLGLAHLVPTPTGSVVVETEGGHATMASSNRREDSVIAHLRERMGHVSAERVLSGPGLVNLYETIAALDRAAAPPRRPEEISAAALAGSCPVCRAALDMFCGLLGSFAGNVALMAGARGGIFIAGGIVPGVLGHLAESEFRSRFEDKGRYRDYLSAVPTKIVVHPDPAFLGLRTLAERGFRLG